jgi:hypothetical protein
MAATRVGVPQNIPTVVYAVPPDDEQVVLETCAYYVGWLLPGLEFHKIYQLLYMHCLLMMSK